MNGGKKGGASSFGYTIVEVMIFMAISGFMFVLAAIFIQGKQAAVEFRQGMNGANTLVRTVVNEVANGEYDSLGNYKCSAASGTLAFSTTAPKVDQGANGGANGCIFLGKVIQLNVGGDATAYRTYSVAARQFASDTTPISSFANAQPRVVAGTSSPDLTVRGNLQGGLEVTHMYKCSAGDSECNGGSTIGAFGFFGSFGGFAASSSGDQQSGAQSVVTAVVPNISYGADSSQSSINTLNTNLKAIDSSDIIGSGSYILLCFENGAKKGSVAIGGPSGQQFTTTIKIGNEPAKCKTA